MLILAGVAIAAVVNGDGLFNRARESAGVYENAARDEGDTIQSMINQIDEYLGNKSSDENNKIEKITPDGYVLMSDGMIRDAIDFWNSTEITINDIEKAPIINKINDNFFSTVKIEKIIGDGYFPIVKTTDGKYVFAGGYKTWYDEENTEKLNSIGKHIKEVNYTYNLYWAIDEEGGLWLWGDNSDGEVGNGTTEEQVTPYKITAIDRKVEKIYYFDSNIYAIDEDGSLWAWGYNKKGQIGNGTNENQLTPYKITTIDKKILEVAYSSDTVYAIDEEGGLWSWGNNVAGQCGIGNNKNQTTPQKITAIDKKVIQVIAANSNMYAIDEDGAVWSCGGNGDGDLGIGSTTNQNIPQKITAINKKVIKLDIMSYYGTIYAIDEEGGLWSWGNNEKGQVGNGSTENQLTPYKIVAIDKKIIETTSSFGTVYALAEEGVLWSWGNNDQGHVGNGNIENQLIPYKITTIDKKINQIHFDNSAAFAIDEEGNLWSWGNNNGIVGNGTTEEQLTPYKITAIERKIKQVVSDQSNVYALDEDGNLWGWGESFEYNLLVENPYIPYCLSKEKETILYNPIDIENRYVLSEDGTIYDLLYSEIIAKNTNIVKFVSGDRYYELGLDKNGNICNFDGTIIEEANYQYVWNQTCIDKEGKVFLYPNGFESEKIQLEFEKKIIKVVDGLALDEEGNIWTWEEETFQPKKITFDKKVVDIAKGGNLLDENGKVWNLFYELGENYEVVISCICLSDIEESPLYNKKIFGLGAFYNDGTFFEYFIGAEKVYISKR